MDKFLYLLCGPAGCGKSTYVKNDIAINGEPERAAAISRDKIRFSLLEENDEYFSKEKLVFDTFVKQINKAIDNPQYDHIYVDATHITPGSRRKILKRLNIKKVRVVAVNLIISEEEVVTQNSQRTGRALVPEDVVRNMCKSFIPATTEEEDIDFVLNIERGE